MKIVYLPLMLLLLAGPAVAGPPEADPASREDSASAMTAPVRFFQRYLSGADGERCPMTPSCSSYALEAIDRYGFVKGWIMASARLLRCGHDELALNPSVMTPSGIRCLDPVTNNDFWLR